MTNIHWGSKQLYPRHCWTDWKKITFKSHIFMYSNFFFCSFIFAFVFLTSYNPKEHIKTRRLHQQRPWSIVGRPSWTQDGDLTKRVGLRGAGANSCRLTNKKIWLEGKWRGGESAGPISLCSWLEIEHSKPRLLPGDTDCRQLGSQITVAVVEVVVGGGIGDIVNGARMWACVGGRASRMHLSVRRAQRVGH